ncbi:MAG: AMP-binding protein [Elusimicrobia bacterium]|nr:AMP-binding protein [Elusimicrobiota bacterium]
MNELKNLYECLVNSASKAPKKTALIFQGSRRHSLRHLWVGWHSARHLMSQRLVVPPQCGCSEKIYYHELLFFTDRAADMFWQMGIRKSDKAAIVLRNSPEFIISYLALAKLGAISVPVNFMISKEDELEYILKNSGAKGVLTQCEFLKNLKHLRTKVETLEFVLCADDPHGHDFWHYLKRSHYHGKAQTPEPRENDPVSILYTSGTTGHPKGVILTHGNLISNANSCIQALCPDENEVFLCLLPMFHTFSWTASVMLPLILGAKIVIAPNLTPPKPWLNAMGIEGVTIFTAIPQLLSVLAKEAKGFKKLFLKYWCFRKLKFCVSGAAPLNPSIKRNFEKAFGLPVLEGYGLTETSPVVSVNLPEKQKDGSVGKPVPGVKVKIIDEHGKHLERGEEGEICVHGASITCGYHENPEATKELFTHDGWLKTGDIGILDNEGFLHIRDRKKDMVIVKGLKVFPAQIEHVLANHPKIHETAVIGIPDGEGGETMKCFCVPRKDVSLEKSEVFRFIKEHLDPYKRPREVEIVESLPKNSMQKVLKRALLKQELEKKFKIKV